MKIKTKIIILNLTVLLTAAITGSYLVTTYQKVPRNLYYTQKINMVVEELFNLHSIINDYHFQRLNRASRQWKSSSKKLDRYLQDLDQNAVINNRYIEALQDSHSRIKLLFEQLMGAQKSRPFPSAQEQRIISQISTQIQDMILWNHIILETIQAQLKQANNRANMLIILFALGMVFIMIAFYIFFSKTILAPLSKLEQGARIVGKGEFDYIIPEVSNDELGHLAFTFNQMTHNLKVLTKSREQFLSTAAHELKTPIAVIKTTVQLIQMLPQEQQLKLLPQKLKTLDRQCNRLNKLVRDVLDISRLDLKQTVLDKKDFNIAELITKVVEEMQQTTDNHQLIIINNPEIIVNADPDRIEQVMVNILDNAIKYSPNKENILLSSSIENNKFVLSVKDFGIGIPKAKQKHIFEQFFRAHTGTAYDYVTSLGVGLYLSREFVIRHGGEMWFDSNEGQGSIFYFSLPLAHQPGNSP